ncbi:hypothetical protein [Bacillus solimangrovi]|uniref:Uncharacterized protein n=1 Tax=Bacillus solimangrovi TaxID=1305675 RepID=A0A1E5LD28_9BACI|nr:hypothetical protein [Bacillus solimangrovi]OEH91973.1 hypothetical protein BFG57_17460 [Bacillus solimangrovi]
MKKLLSISLVLSLLFSPILNVQEAQAAETCSGSGYYVELTRSYSYPFDFDKEIKYYEGGYYGVLEVVDKRVSTYFVQLTFGGCVNQ